MTMRYRVDLSAAALTASLLSAATALAGEADVLAVEAHRTGSGVYRFDVTVEHADSGWDHYANQWQIVAPDGRVLGTRVLLHPHVGEQPFTRSLSDVVIAPDIRQVTIRAYDSVHQDGGKEIVVNLTDVD